MTIRWRVLPTPITGVVRIEIDKGTGFRAATTAEIDQALRQLPLFGAADAGAQVARAIRSLSTDRVECRGHDPTPERAPDPNLSTKA